MRGVQANSDGEESEIKQIGPFKKSLSEYGRVWTWIVFFFFFFLNLFPIRNLKISISEIVEKF